MFSLARGILLMYLRRTSTEAQEPDMKLYVSKVNLRFEVTDEDKYLVAVFFDKTHAMLFCNAMFLTRKAEEVYGIDGKLIMGKLDDLLADMGDAA
jgi:hypothetical protein